MIFVRSCMVFYWLTLSFNLIQIMQQISSPDHANNGGLYRLEAATSRLEDMAMSLEDPNVSKSVDSSPAAVPSVPEPPKPAPPPQAPPAAPQVPPQIQDFDALIKGDVQNFVKLGEKIGGLVAEQVRSLRRRHDSINLSLLMHFSTSREQFCKPSRPNVHTFMSRRRLRSPMCPQSSS